jgi:hypothetical protein
MRVDIQAIQELLAVTLGFRLRETDRVLDQIAHTLVQFATPFRSPSGNFSDKA